MDCPSFEVRKIEYLFEDKKRKNQVNGYYAEGNLNNQNVRTSGKSALELGANLFEEAKKGDDLRTIELEDTSEKRRTDSLHGLIFNVPLTNDEFREVISGYIVARSKYYTQTDKK